LYVRPRCSGPKSAKNAVYINSESITKLLIVKMMIMMIMTIMTIMMIMMIMIMMTIMIMIMIEYVTF
jgi:hypothetical protein